MSRKTNSRPVNRTVIRDAAVAVFEPMEARTLYSASPVPQVVGYLQDWQMSTLISQDGNTGAVTSDKINWSALTQLNYFSVRPTDAGQMPARTSSDIDPATQLPALVGEAQKDTSHPVRVNIVVGGGDATSIASLTKLIDGGQAKYDAFAASAEQFCKANHLSGVDLDWEPEDYTAGVRATPAEVAGYGQLIRTMHQTFAADHTGLTLSAAVRAEQQVLSDGSLSYVLNPTAVQNLDLINVMTYDLDPTLEAPMPAVKADMAAWGAYVTGHAAATGTSQTGRPATTGVVVGGSIAKLVRGIPFYGADGSGNLAYGDIVAQYGQPADAANTAGPWHFDGPATVRQKTADALTAGEAGVMVWDLAKDYYAGDVHGQLLTNIGTAVSTLQPTPSPTPTPTPSLTRLTGSTISSDRFENNGQGAGQPATLPDGTPITIGVGHLSDTSDGNANTGFASLFADGWFGIHLDRPSAVAQVQVAPRPGYGFMMQGGAIQGSATGNFDQDGVNLATIGAAPADGQMTVLNVANTAAFGYLRYVAPLGSYGMAGEVDFFAKAPTPTSTPTPVATPAKLTGTVIGTTGSYQNGGNTRDKAFDGNANSFVDAATADGNWVGLDLGSAKSVTSLSFTPRAGFASRMAGGTFQASNTADFTAGTVTLYAISGTPAATATTVNVTAAGTYRYVRYVSPNGGWGNVAEVGFTGTTPPVARTLAPATAGPAVSRSTPFADSASALLDSLRQH